MKVRPIQKPLVKESLKYGKIISWKFREKITPIRKTFAIRLEITFENGKSCQIQRGGYSTRTEALHAKEIAITELYNNEFIPFEYSIQEFYDFWLYYHMLDEKKITYGTFCTYRNVIYNYIIKFWGAHKKILSIERADVYKLLNSIDSDSVLRTTYVVLRGSFIYAKEHQIIRMNPVLTAIRFKKKAVKNALIQSAKEGKVELRPKEYPILTTSQVALLLNQCKENYPEMYMPLLICITTGLRISEAIGVKYSDIDWLQGELHISRQLGRATNDAGADNGRICTQELKPKSWSGNRSVPLADFVIDELILARRKYEIMENNATDFNNLDFVCCQENGLPYNRSSFGKKFKRLLKNCNLPDMRWHDLRHTYATILKENDINLKAISACMGHHEVKITENVYINIKEPIYDCSKEIGSFIAEIMPGEKNILEIPIDPNYLLEVLP